MSKPHACHPIWRVWAGIWSGAAGKKGEGKENGADDQRTHIKKAT